MRLGSPMIVAAALVLSASVGACETERIDSAVGGRGGGGSGPARFGTLVSSTLALDADGRRLFVVSPDSDSVSVIDTATRSLVREIPLGGAPPAIDPETQRYEPRYSPRAVAIAGGRAYVAAQAKNAVVIVDTSTLEVVGAVDVPAAPVSVAASPDGATVFVVSHEAGIVSAIDAASATVRASTPVSQHPWGASVSQDGERLFVTHLLLEPGVTVLSARDLAPIGETALPEEPAGDDARVPNGVVRGAFSAVPRPGSGELWVPHLLLAVGTAQPDLDFESTVFPTLTLLTPDGAAVSRRLSFRPSSIPGAKGAFADVVSGPRAVAFTPDAKLSLVADESSEDVMVFDAETGIERSLVRPIPSTMVEGIVVAPDGRRAYVSGRNSHDVTVLSIDDASALEPVRVDGPPIDCLVSDPMPPELRRGQRLFYTSNSAVVPVTRNFWVACATCHIEGGSDAVTWLFSQGPRDTPSNAGGPVNTGFLMRQATRNSVTQYDETIRVEQGGHFDRTVPAQAAELDDLAAYVNRAIPYPQNPHLSASGLTERQMAGQVLFQARCISCHAGEYATDSGAGNPTLDWSGPVVLHDVGTCVTSGAHPDRASTAVSGVTRSPCELDTPSLRGVFATPPYFHDGSAPTLLDTLDRLPFSSDLSADDKARLVEYLETL